MTKLKLTAAAILLLLLNVSHAFARKATTFYADSNVLPTRTLDMRIENDILNTEIGAVMLLLLVIAVGSFFRNILQHKRIVLSARAFVVQSGRIHRSVARRLRYANLFENAGL